MLKYTNSSAGLKNQRFSWRRKDKFKRRGIRMQIASESIMEFKEFLISKHSITHPASIYIFRFKDQIFKGSVFFTTVMIYHREECNYTDNIIPCLSEDYILDLREAKKDIEVYRPEEF
jgi:hypothetical protein